MLVKRNDVPVFSRIFNDFFDKEFFDWSNNNYAPENTTLPAVNIKETESEFRVELAVPGMNKKDFKIDLRDNVLTISSEKETKTEEDNDVYTRKEYNYQSFTRMFTLPDTIVDSDKIKAEYINGELIISIPKKEEAKKKEPRMIAIK
jgi:HSP20 family protein